MSGKRGFIHDLMDELENNANIHRSIVGRIERILDHNVVLYIANPGHPAALIQDHDADILEGILRSVDLKTHRGTLDLVIDSPGGLPYAAEKLVNLCRAYATEFRVIVPSQAMSAATLVALGSDAIVMSKTSKLGPIDPQMVYQTDKGAALRPAKSFVDAYTELVQSATKAISQGLPADAFLHLLSRIDMSWVIECAKARKATEIIAAKLLGLSMMAGKTDAEVKKVVEQIVQLGEEIHHGKPLYRDEAEALGLNVVKVDNLSREWTLIWELYVRCQRYANEKTLAKYMCSRQGGIDLRVQIQQVRA